MYRYRVLPAPRADYVVGAVEAITGHAPATLYADPRLAKQTLHPSDWDELVAKPADDLSFWKRPIMVRSEHPGGRVVWAEHHRVPVHDANGSLVAVEAIARDVTERIETQRQLKASQDQLRRLAASLQTAREEERASLARELHDELGQTLTALKLELNRTTEVLKKSGHTAEPETMNRLQSLVGLVEIGVAMVKRISSDLRPPALDHLGLAEAIRWEASAFRARSGVRCQVVADKEQTSLGTPQQVAMFRIFQEALTNVVRHAHASAVQVRLTESRGVFELRVKDNGRGITAAESTDTHSIGLIGMRERAMQAGATLAIAGRRGKGTVVTVRVPLPSRGRRSPKTRRRAGSVKQ
jgi:PAS domain S-box-containing protein